MGDNLRTTLGNIQENLKNNPSEATVTFQSNSTLIEGFNSRAVLRQHSIDVDEPKELGGTDRGPNPVRARRSRTKPMRRFSVFPWRAFPWSSRASSIFRAFSP